MLTFPQRVLAGELPHRDFLHLYGPGSLYVLALVFKVFGSTLGVERLVGAVQHLVLVLGVFALARPWGRKASVLASLTTLVITISPLGLSAMAWNGALALAAVGLACIARATRVPSRNLLVCGGLCFGGALLYRPDMAVAIGLATLVAWRIFAAVGELRSLRRWLLIGIVVPLLAYIPFLLAVGPGDALTGMFVQPVFDLRAGRSLPVPPSWSSPDGFLQRTGSFRDPTIPGPMLGTGAQIALWFWAVLISEVFVVVCAWKAYRSRPQARTSQILAIAAAFSFGLIGQALQRPDTAHLAWVSAISFAVLPLGIIEWVRSRPHPPDPETGSLRRVGEWICARPVLGFVPVGLMLAFAFPYYPLNTYTDLVGQSFGRNVFGSPIHRGDRVFYYGNAAIASDAQHITDVLADRSEPGEKLIVGPLDLSKTPYSDAFFYYFFPELRPGTRYIEMDPGIADAPESGLARELRSNTWLIQSRVWSHWAEPNESTVSGDQAPNRVVRDDYCVVTDTRYFRLLRHCRG